MSQTLAPYNNSMRLGQGFNSYTQQICLDRAVLPLPNQQQKARVASSPANHGPLTPTSSEDESGDLVAADYQAQPQGRGPPTPLKAMPWVKPQIVTYSSHFVDKISDITNAMNVSGSLSIKTATVGGKANGSYIDSDKFNSSDINYHLQVKVTNQIYEPPEYCIFNKISKVKKEEFPEVYGDCFVSGWEEGGELNAVISIKVHDKSKIHEIKAKVEGEMSTPTISGEIKVKYGLTENNLSKSTETTISVNWSGGGSIKDPTEDWSIATLKKAAAAFPDLVAVTPQRTYAILTKYTSLADFQMKKDDFSPLDYESAGIYTSALLDHYMDYKAMWKQISHATYELKGNRATIEMARPGEETYSLATIQPLPTAQVDAKSFELLQASTALGIESASQQQADAQALIVHQENCIDTHKTQQKQCEQQLKAIKFPVFSPTFAGLIHARKVCRFEMAKIVNEVDLVAKNPKLATDTTRDSYFLNPLVFEQLVPIVRSLSPDSAKLRIRDPNAAILLGYVPPTEEPDALPPVHDLRKPLESHDIRLQNSIQRCSWKAQDYIMQGTAGLTGPPWPIHSSALFANDLETLDATFRLKKISVWSADLVVQGIRLDHAKGVEKSHGSCVGPPSHVWELAKDGSEIIVEVVIRDALFNRLKVISSIAFVTSNCNIFDTAVKQEEEKRNEPAAATPASTNTDTKPAEGNPPAESKLAAPAVLPVASEIHTFLRPNGGQWSLRGFFTFCSNPTSDLPAGTPCSLGVVWSKDTFVPIPAAALSSPICKSFLCLGKALQDNVSRFKTLNNYAHFADKFLLGVSAAATDKPAAAVAAQADTAEAFNALDKIDVDWTIKTMAFASAGGRLTGLKVIYNNGQELTHGKFEREVWRCDVNSGLVVARLTAGRASPGAAGYVDTVEFIRGVETNGKSERAAWPLDVSTLRYLGEGSVRVAEDVCTVVEEAPNMGGNATWTVRGLYGECKDGIISRLGVVWGRG